MGPPNGRSRIESPPSEWVMVVRCLNGLRASGLSAMQAFSLEIIEPALADDREHRTLGQHHCHRFTHPLESAIDQAEGDRAAQRRAEVARGDVTDHFYRRGRNLAGFRG